MTTSKDSDEYLLRITQTNQSFSRITPGLQIAWDSTSLGLLKSCPYKYYLTMLEGYVRKSTPDPLMFGIAFHSAMEIYTKLETKVGHDQAQRVAIRVALDEYGHVDEDTGAWTPHHPDPEGRDVKLRSRENLLRAVVWYLEHYRNDPMGTYYLKSGKAAAELSFRFELGTKSNAGESYLVAGHLDKVVKCNDDLWVLDYKTCKVKPDQKFFSQFSPSPQMSLYDFAGHVVLDTKISGVIIDGVQLMTHSARFGRGFAPRTPGQRKEWVSDLKFWIRTAETYAAAAEWPMNDTSCSMYGGCTFKGVCSQDPSVRSVFLNADFHKRKWDPLESR